MPDRIEKLKKLFGEDFVRKYQEAKEKAQILPEKRLAEIKDFAIKLMREQAVSNPEFDYHVIYENLDILLVNTPESDHLREVKETSAGNYKITMVWYGSKSLRGPFVSVFVPRSRRDWADEMTRTPGEAFLIVGKLQEREYEGDVTYSFRLAGVITLEGYAEDEEVSTSEFSEGSFI